MAKEENNQEPEKSDGGGRKKILLIVAPILLLVVAAFAFVQFAVPANDAEGAEPEAEKEQDPSAEWTQETHRLEVLFVNLAETNGKRFLKVGIMLQFSAARPAEELARFMKDDTLIKDRLITLLSGKTLDDIDGAETKRLLKYEILDSLNDLLYADSEHEGRIDQVYYHEFLVQ